MSSKIEMLKQKVCAIEARTVSSPAVLPSPSAKNQGETHFCGSAGFDSIAPEEDINKRVRWSAMELLARREHSVRELTNKLLKRFPESPSIIAECLAVLSRENLQSDERFCEAYVAMRKRKGYGPQRIASELRERGVNEALAKAQLRAPEHNWYQTAEETWRRKFRGQQPVDLREKARQVRFMTYRGFYQEHIQAVLP